MTAASRKQTAKLFLTFAGLLIIILTALFFRSFDPRMVCFSNDGPYGGMRANHAQMPQILTGYWQDLNWIGYENPSLAPTLSAIWLWITGPLIFSKTFYPFTLCVLGLSVWFCLHRWKLASLACLMGGFAAALSSHFLSTACWGVAAQILAIAWAFIALGLLADSSPRSKWIRIALGGLAVGMCVMEGYDIGAILSLFVAAFVVYQALIGEGENLGRKAGLGVARVAVVAVFAAFLSAHALSTLIGTQIKGIAGTEQTAEAKEERWSFATQWSFPPAELPQLFVAGAYGYRMDTPKDMGWIPSAFEGGSYWGAIGRPEQVDRMLQQYYSSGRQGSPPQGGPENFRFSGGGEYAGILVVVIALWSVVQSWRKKDSVFSQKQRKFVWFWTVAAVISLLLSFGRYAPFYRMFYALPYASTIRNATKFTHTFHLSLVILFAYGIHGICRRYLEPSTQALSGPLAHLKLWWKKASGFDKGWTRFCLFAIVASFLAWLLSSSSRSGLETLLKDTGFHEPEQAGAIASFSIHSLGWFIPLLVLVVFLLVLLISGWFAGSRARLGSMLLGTLLVIDLARADLPWIIYWNYPDKYSSNPVIDLLKQKPEDHRVAILPLERFLRLDQLPASARPLVENYIVLYKLYHVEWKQQHFEYYNIPCLDVVQMPRVPADLQAFSNAVLPSPVRNWELTSTKYLLGPTAALPLLNQQIDPVQKRFRIVMQFDIVPKPGVVNGAYPDQLTAATSTNGGLALFEFTGALPRAKLYTNWQVVTNDHDTLEQLPNPTFNPAQTVLVADPIPAPAKSGSTNDAAGTLEYVSYAPKKLVFHAKASSPSILMLTDKFDPHWKVFVDDKPERVLRCDYIMRGVQVPAGDHKVEFRFEPPISSLYVSSAGVFLLVILSVCLFLIPEGPQQPVANPLPAKTSAKAAAPR